jgi:hypothetical protein
LVNFGVNRRYGAVLCRLAGVIIFQLMRELLLLAIHLLVTLAKFLGPGGVRRSQLSLSCSSINS